MGRPKIHSLTNVSSVNWGVLEHQLPPLWLPPPCDIIWSMLGQELRVKEYYDVMIHKHHSEDVYGLIDLRVGGAHLKGFAQK